ncbi:MAG TPA: hypothetical protein VGE74_16995 [Gemmata sp.]
MPTYPWMIRPLIALVLVAPLGLFALGPAPVARPAPDKETDLQRVYARVSEECLYQNLHKWCGLRVSDATPDEAAQLRAAVESAPDPKEVWCGPLDEIRRNAPPKSYRFPDGIRWYRLSHPTDRGRWVGIGVFEHHNTGWTAYWVRCRVAVGFEP